MPTNPTITAYPALDEKYSVGDSDTAYYDVELATDLADPAEFIVTAPAGAQVHAWGLAGGETTVRWEPAGVEVALLAGGAWQSPVTLGGWQLAIATGAAPTDPALVTVSSGAAEGGPLRVRVRGIRASAAAATVTLQAQSNAATWRILADPMIGDTPAPAEEPVAERRTCTLVGNPEPAVEEGAGLPEHFGEPPHARGEWTRITGETHFLLTTTPDSGGSAQFEAPGVRAPTVESFEFRAYYDLDGDGAFTAGEPDNVEPVDVTIEPLKWRMVLVLDRSGSMRYALPGGSTSKWEAAKRRAHAWLDLFAAFRPPSDQTVGFLTFERDPYGGLGGYGPCAHTTGSDPDVTFRDPATGEPVRSLRPLGDFAALSAIDLGSPRTATPIGDALVRAVEVLEMPSLGVLDACAIVLLTDGRENSGCTTIKSALPPGARKLFAEVLNGKPAVKSRLALYSIGAGSDVDEDTLNNLPTLGMAGEAGGGYYRLATTTTDLQESFLQMLGDSIDADDVGMRSAPDGPDAGSMLFETNSQEHRLAVLAEAGPTDTLQLSYRAQGSSESWRPLSGAGVTSAPREHHWIAVVELETALAGLGTTAADWKLVRLNGDGPQPIEAAVGFIDLHLKMTVSFDKPAYRTGEPIVASARIVAGKDPVRGATVVALSEAPDQGVGTYLATNGSQVAGQTPVTQLADGKLDLRIGDQAVGHVGGDAPTAKGALFDYFLRRDELEALPRSDGIFADGTDRLYDDGAHDDGAADDGCYANRFTATDKEGTYTFRFEAEGTLPDGSRFRRTATVSTWVGVRPDPASSTVTITALASPPPGMTGRVIAVTPRDARGELLGPFRDHEVVIEASAGSFTGPVESRIDGSYARTLVYRPGEDPRVTVEAGGVPLAVLPAKREGCCGLFRRLIRCVLRRLRFWRRP